MACWAKLLNDSSDSRRATGLLPLLTGRNTGPSAMLAAAIQSCSRVTGLRPVLVPRGMTTSWACSPRWLVLDRGEREDQAAILPRNIAEV